MRKRPGFTLLEILVVLFISGLLMGMTTMRLRATTLRADASARLVRSTLQTQQRNAISRQSNTIVTFDFTRNGLLVIEDYNSNDSVNVGERQLWRPLSDGTVFATPTMGTLAGTPSSNGALDGTAIRTINSKPAIIFRRDGSASSDLTVYLTARPSVPSEYRAIVVDPGTGRVDLWRYSGTGWMRMTQ
jgi:prepilin-type N-terminal cleavage/methylation domain-containing protein